MVESTKNLQNVQIPPYLDNTNGWAQEERVKAMTMSQLRELGEEIELSVPSEISKDEFTKQIILRLDWLHKRLVKKSAAATVWEPPRVKSPASTLWNIEPANTGINIEPESVVSFPSKRNGIRGRVKPRGRDGDQ